MPSKFCSAVRIQNLRKQGFKLKVNCSSRTSMLVNLMVSDGTPLSVDVGLWRSTGPKDKGTKRTHLMSNLTSSTRVLAPIPSLASKLSLLYR